MTDVNPLRTFEIMSLKLVPNPMSGIDQAIDLSDQIRQRGDFGRRTRGNTYFTHW
ncbi:MAG: hypothetical protein ACLR8Y_08950 [Alistipes indistinctus]